jgi:hypothetical protein
MHRMLLALERLAVDLAALADLAGDGFAAAVAQDIGGFGRGL